MKLRSNCKINIGLNVVARRKDGYHDLETVMYPLYDLYDEITIELAHGSGNFTANGIVVDCPTEENLCIKAQQIMARRYGIPSLDITLDKRIPFGAGLGGGSSNAASIVCGINAMFQLGLSEQRLIDILSELGSDTAFFVRNTPQLCTGRGNIMQPINITQLTGKYLVLLKPDEGVSTREAYQGVKPQCAQINLAEALSRPLEEWKEVVKNDFEPHILSAHPKIAQLKEYLYDSGAIYASMSGSGSSVYGIFDDTSNIHPEFDNTFIHIQKL